MTKTVLFTSEFAVVCSLIIKLIYSNQTIQMKCRTCIWNQFTVTSWVRQRRVVSAYLLAIYFDELSILLGLPKVRCTVRNMFANFLMFSVDILCLLDPSISDLQHLLSICCGYAAKHEIVFNCKKTGSTIPTPKKYKQCIALVVYLNGIGVKLTEKVN